MTRKIPYTSELVIAPKAWGKTFYLDGRARYLATRESVRTVHVVDPPEDFTGRPDYEIFRSFDHYNRRLNETDRLPRLAVWQLGREPERYQPVFEHLISQGDCVLLLDEAQVFAPVRKGILVPELADIAAMGRHLTNCLGESRPTHLICATQRPTGIDATLRDQLLTVVSGGFRAGAARDWIRKEVDSDALDMIDRLGVHEWACLAPRGAPVPRRAPIPE